MKQKNIFDPLVGIGAMAMVLPLLVKNMEAAKTFRISKHPVVLFICFDGLRHDYLHKGNTPVMDYLEAAGVKVPYMLPSFPTMTFPQTQTMATGLYVESHGIILNTFWDPEVGKFLDGFEDDPGFWNYRGDVLPIWILNELAGNNRRSGGLMWPGSQVPYGPNHNLYPTYYRPGRINYMEVNTEDEFAYEDTSWEWRVKTVITWLTHPSRPANLVLLFNVEPDATIHGFGPYSPEADEEVRLADGRLGYLIYKLREAGIFHKINIILTSDHGMDMMTQREISNITKLFTDIDPEGKLIERVHMGPTITDLSAKPGKLDELYGILQNHSKAYNFTLYRKTEMGEPFNFNSSRRIMDLVMLAKSSHTFDQMCPLIDGYNRRWNITPSDDHLYGFHGYSHLNPTMRVPFIAHGPAFKKRWEHPAYFKNVDIFPLLCFILGIPEPPNNGSLAKVKDMLSPDFFNKRKF